MDDTEIIVDASVVIKWFAPEEYSPQARALRDAYLDGEATLGAPAHLPYEVANGLRYSDFLTDEEVETSMESLGEYGITEYAFKQIPGIIERSLSEDVTVYDAAYVALADQQECVCYTADERLLTAIDTVEHAGELAHIRDFHEDIQM